MAECQLARLSERAGGKAGRHRGAHEVEDVERVEALVLFFGAVGQRLTELLQRIAAALDVGSSEENMR